MALDPTEREVVASLIGSVRTVAAQLVSLHLQLGAMRSLLAKKQMMTDDEFHAAFAELEAMASTEERLRDFPDVMADVFEELLRRLQMPQHLDIAPD
jgi:hypothetical protein